MDDANNGVDLNVTIAHWRLASMCLRRTVIEACRSDLKNNILQINLYYCHTTPKI